MRYSFGVVVVICFVCVVLNPFLVSSSCTEGFFSFFLFFFFFFLFLSHPLFFSFFPSLFSSSSFSFFSFLNIALSILYNSTNGPSWGSKNYWVFFQIFSHFYLFFFLFFNFFFFFFFFKFLFIYFFKNNVGGGDDACGPEEWSGVFCGCCGQVEQLYLVCLMLFFFFFFLFCFVLFCFVSFLFLFCFSLKPLLCRMTTISMVH